MTDFSHSFGGSVSSQDPDRTFVGGNSGGGAVLHPAKNNDAGLCTHDCYFKCLRGHDPLVSTMDGRGASTSIITAGAVPDISTTGGRSLV